MADKTTKERYVTICPECGSDEVSFEQDAVYAAAGMINQFKQCNNCGYHGMVFPEVPASKVRKNPKNAKEIKNVPLVQTSYGQGYTKVLVYVILPLLVLIILIYLRSRS